MGTSFMRTSCRGMGRTAQWRDKDSAIDLRVILYVMNKFQMPSIVKIPR